MLPLLTAVAPIALATTKEVAPELAGYATQAAITQLNPTTRALRKETLAASRRLRKGTFGYTDPQRLALLRGGQAQAQALQAQGQAAITQQQAAQGGPISGGYAQGQQAVARASQDAAQQNVAAVQMADDAEAQRQKDADLRLVQGEAAAFRQRASASAQSAGTNLTKAAMQQTKDYKNGEGEFEYDFDGLESAFKTIPAKRV
jgi:hypothetical protein